MQMKTTFAIALVGAALSKSPKLHFDDNDGSCTIEKSGQNLNIVGCTLTVNNKSTVNPPTNAPTAPPTIPPTGSPTTVDQWVGEQCTADSPISCQDILNKDPQSADGEYAICENLDHTGAMQKVYCLQSWNGGGYTAIARVKQETYATQPPSIVSASYANWNSWVGHSWRSGSSYYLSLAQFGARTGLVGGSEVVQMNRNSAGVVGTTVQFGGANYRSAQNDFNFQGCYSPEGKCTSAYCE